MTTTDLIIKIRSKINELKKERSNSYDKLYREELYKQIVFLEEHLEDLLKCQ